MYDINIELNRERTEKYGVKRVDFYPYHSLEWSNQSTLLIYSIMYFCVSRERPCIIRDYCTITNKIDTKIITSVMERKSLS